MGDGLSDVVCNVCADVHDGVCDVGVSDGVEKRTFERYLVVWF